MTVSRAVSVGSSPELQQRFFVDFWEERLILDPYFLTTDQINNTSNYMLLCSQLVCGELLDPSLMQWTIETSSQPNSLQSPLQKSLKSFVATLIQPCPARQTDTVTQTGAAGRLTRLHCRQQEGGSNGVMWSQSGLGHTHHTVMVLASNPGELLSSIPPHHIIISSSIYGSSKHDFFSDKAMRSSNHHFLRIINCNIDFQKIEMMHLELNEQSETCLSNRNQFLRNVTSGSDRSNCNLYQRQFIKYLKLLSYFIHNSNFKFLEIIS